ncbi:DedA family protein [Paenibacillus sonchi]|uniref:DedA family protein n=1 Tax=Paenibacillus sonchi TaxID=373687 RepID=UPI0006857723|nr:hypothetical protein [Paenibacillus sonchi]
MISNTLLALIDQYGYWFFYVAFSLGPLGVPIPNEIMVLTAAILSRTGVLNSGITYLSILSGFLTAITLFHFAGRWFGQRFKHRLYPKPHFQKAEKLLQEVLSKNSSLFPIPVLSSGR